MMTSATESIVAPAGRDAATANAITARRVFMAPLLPTKKCWPAPLLSAPSRSSKSVLSFDAGIETVSAEAGRGPEKSASAQTKSTRAAYTNPDSRRV